jgi:outer membrane lipoprotein carrier protein
MKKLTSLLITALVSFTALAQYDPDAKAVLDAMSANYRKATAFSANFSQQIVNKNAGLDETLSGKITVKGNKYKLEVSEQEVYNNGKEVWAYSPENLEVTVSKYDPAEEEITLSNVYDLYKKGFKYSLVSIQPNGDRIVELGPEDRSKTYFKIRMVINSGNELKNFTVFEKSGNNYTYTVENYKALTAVADATFIFDKAKAEEALNKGITDPKKKKVIEVVDFR